MVVHFFYLRSSVFDLWSNIFDLGPDIFNLWFYVYVIWSYVFDQQGDQQGGQEEKDDDNDDFQTQSKCKKSDALDARRSRRGLKSIDGFTPSKVEKRKR